ncbi:DNA ligase 3 [Aricia agestis]|uniref:DNA ligase 3 n=1 Tax=Aricia agestis TaxID=91739 RepID=UPI001C20AE60|nr:DNA ligase 3 [Aricia agestis]
MSESTPFFIDRAKGSRASCKGCKGNCPSGELRIAKLVYSPYGENQQMKSWHHIDCLMNVLLKQRPTTKRIDSINDIGNWENISKEDQELVLKKINEMEKLYEQKNNGKYTAKVIKNEAVVKQKPPPEAEAAKTKETDDNKFSTFHKICQKIAKVDAYTEKTAVVNNFFTKGINGTFEGDIYLWCKLLLPQACKRIYNLKSKQLVKLFSRIFNTDQDDMLTHLEQGDVADTIQHFFSKSKSTVQPASESTLTIQQMEDFLEDLSKLTKEEEQIYHFKKIVKKCDLNDMKMLIRLIKGDLRINAGPKHILEGVHPDAYTAFQTSRDLTMVLQRVLPQNSGVKHKDLIHKNVQAKLSLMTPVLPMLAEACKSVEMAMKKCPNGMFSEIKYDGERVQVHKKGKEFKYFSRALKPVMAHKVSHFKDYLPQAFPKGDDLILDAEVLMVDVTTGKPLPFGTLGIHKQSEFKDASVCLYIFDCLYYNGEVLIDKPIKKRRQILHEIMVEIQNHVMFSEQQLIRKPADLANMIAKVLQLGLEGLVLKDLESTYEPGKRHWLKVKKDYLFDGAMADTADLVVLGAWFGTGKKGGMMSVFLMGCLDKRRNKWVTVTKVHTGHDDKTLERLQKELGPKMVKISGEYAKVPHWLDCNKGMVPDFIAADPKKQPVWEITGTELTKANLHTGDGISVRFPRVTRIRDDKDWETATNLDELRHLYKTSKEKTDVSLLNKLAETAAENDDSPPKKIKASPSKANTLDKFLVKDEKSPKSHKSKDKDKVSEKKRKRKTISSDSEDEIDTKETKVYIDSPSCSKNIKESPTSKSKDRTSDKKRKRKESTDSDNTIIDDSLETIIKKEVESPKEESPKVEKKIKLEKKIKTEVVDEEESPKKEKYIKHKKVRTKAESKEIIPDDEDYSEPENPLPDAFKDKRLGFYPDFISIPEEEGTHFERHWIAYGGEVVKSIKRMDVDFVVHNEDSIEFKQMLKLNRKVPEKVRHVSKTWLNECINSIQLINPKYYGVVLLP